MRSSLTVVILCSVLAGANFAMMLADVAKGEWDYVALQAVVVCIMAALVATHAREVRRG